MKVYLLIAVLLYPNIVASDPITELSVFIEDFLYLYPERKKMALSYLPTIIAECSTDIDPLLVAVIISIESSWRFKVRGKLGEKGLMQLMPRYGKGFDLNNPHDQIKAGINHLRKALKYCNGDIKSAVNAIGCGKCKPHGQFLEWRWRWYKKAIKKYRKKEMRNEELTK